MQKAEKMQELRVFAQEIRVETLKTVGSLGFGHVPGAMSVIDALAVQGPRWSGYVRYPRSEGFLPG